MDSDRLMHSYCVAKKMVEIGRKFNLSDGELSDLFILGFNHDIGYEFSINGINHGKIGGELLMHSNYKYYKEIYYHGELTSEYSSLFLDILNMADMQIDKYGNDVGYDFRLKDIEDRYGIDSNIYKKCYELIEYLKSKE